MTRLRAFGVMAGFLTLFATAAAAGPVFLTGHDPDFHAQGQESGTQQLTIALNYVTGGTYNTPGSKFLWVESSLAATPGHRVGADGLAAIGVGAAQYDRVNAAGLAALPNFNGYTAIVVASTFGGMLTSAEIDALIARKAEIASFVNAGGGLAAFAECSPASDFCDASNVAPGTKLFGFVPVDVSSVGTVAPYIVTPFGATLGLTNAMVDDCCTHNSFGQIGGLNVADVDQNGRATTLAGNVRIDDGGFTPVPEPASIALFGAALVGFGAARRRRR